MQIVGLDYASVDDNQSPDFIQAKHAGAQFVILRAIYGRQASPQTGPVFIDPVWQRDKDAIRAAGLKRTAYLYVCYPQSDRETPSPEAQAQAFIDNVQLERGKDFVPMFDVEEQSDILSFSEMYDWTLRVCKALRTHYEAWPGLYTSAQVWQEYLGGQAAGELAECPLWIAKPWPWEEKQPAHRDGAPEYSPRTIPQFGDATNYWIYQYQGDALGWPGFSNTVDVNRFHSVAKGVDGDIVKWIQRRVGASDDGEFGPLTESAVKTFQDAHHLLDDGIVGPQTFAALCWVR